MNQNQANLSLLQYANILDKTKKNSTNSKKNYLEEQIQRVRNTPTLNTPNNFKFKFKI